MTPTPEQHQQWKEKYGTYYELEVNGKSCFIFDPSNSIVIMKALVQAQAKSSADYVDSLVANCWLDGDTELKTDDQFKLGIVDQAEALLDIPEPSIEYNDGEKQATIIVDGKAIKVSYASRQQVKVAEDRNRSGKPLDTQIHLLNAIAKKEDVEEWVKTPRLYLSLLLAMDKVKDKKYVSLKKF